MNEKHMQNAENSSDVDRRLRLYRSLYYVVFALSADCWHFTSRMLQVFTELKDLLKNFVVIVLFVEQNKI